MAPSPTGSYRQSLPSLRKSLIRRINVANNLLNLDSPSHDDPTFEKHIEDLIVAQQTLDSARQKVSELDQQWSAAISQLEDKAQHTQELSLYSQISEHNTDGYIQLLDDAEDLSARLATRASRLDAKRLEALTATAIPTTPPGANPGQSLHSPQQSPNAVDSAGIQHPPLSLPKLVQPTFDWDILKVTRVLSIFETAIHSRVDLSPVAKLSYLIPLLTGSAAQAVKGYNLTDSNYDLIIQRLKERFQRSGDRFISLLHAELKKIPSCGMRTDDRRKTFDACERIYRQLEQEGDTLDPGTSLVFDLLSKFPPPAIRDLDRHYKVGVYSKLSDVRKAIERSIAESELTEGFLKDLIPGKNQSGQSMYKDNGKRLTEYNPPSLSDLRETTLGANARAQREYKGGPHRTSPSRKCSPCYFCAGEHYNSDCFKYPTGISRLQRLRQLNNRCLKCLNLNKLHTDSCWKATCCQHCGGPHNSVLCFKAFPQKQGQGAPIQKPPNRRNQVFHKSSQRVNLVTEVPAVEQSDPPKTTAPTFPPSHTEVSHSVTELVNFSRSCSKNSLFQTAKVNAVNLKTGARHRVRICLDTLSNRSYVLSKTAAALNLTSEGPDKLYISVFGTNKNIEFPSQIVSLGLESNDGIILPLQANTTKIISNSSVLPDEWPTCEEEKLNAWKHCLADDPFDPDKSIDILIGADHAWDIISGAKMTLSDSNIFLIPSIFGFMLGGKLIYDSPSSINDEVTMLCLTPSFCQFPHELGLAANLSKHEPSYPDIDEFWNLETIGITDCPIKDDDTMAQEAFDKSVIYEDGRYHVKWPVIPERLALLPDNYRTAHSRLQNLTERFNRSPDLLQTYQDVVKLQLDRKIVEQVPDDELVTEHTIHYLPHHPVIKPARTTTKVRIVYDASSKAKKTDYCLNECLLRGPVILPDLCQLLMRFRTATTVVISDVEKAFLQVALQKEDRDLTRFLWYRDDSHPSMDPGNLITLRFRSVPFGIISSPFLLGATIQHHLRKEGTEFARQLEPCIYVDNVVSAVPDDETAVQYYDDLKALFARAGMNIQEFCSNSQRLMDEIPVKDRVKDRDVKVLGLKWDSAKDDTIRLIGSVKISNPSLSETKRSILKRIAAIFDPLGLFQPATFPAKLFLQQLWLSGTEWDTTLQPALQSEWSELQPSLNDLLTVRIPRFLGTITDETCLVSFSDASTKGYGAAVYLRTRQLDGSWQSKLLFAKSRLVPVNPKNQISLPRLELLGAVIATSASEFCRNAFFKPNMQVHLFTDSECVLHWLVGNRLLKRFVERRIEKIKATSNFSFGYVSTHDNPADLLTRGTTAKELVENQLWWNGPCWLKVDVEKWPKTRLPQISSEVLQESKVEKLVNISHTLSATESASAESSSGFPFERYSSLQRLIRISWLCMKFIKKFLWSRLSQRTLSKYDNLQNIFKGIEDGPMTPSGHKTALMVLIAQVQRNSFADEFTAIACSKKNTLVRQLNLNINEDGLLLACGRYERADLPQAARTPILLPKNHKFTEMVIQDIHEKVGHSGLPHTLSELRRAYWVPQGRAYVKKVIRDCIICKKIKRKAQFVLPPMPPWPVERVRRSAPFQFVGIDYFGPMKIKVRDSANTQKVWACLFTCLSTRAVHLEPVLDCTATEFHNSLIRFVSRRGFPQQILSDNAAQFRLTKILDDRAWQHTPTDPSLLSYCAQHGIHWKFIVELAPWQGGHYERLVGVVKSVLKSIVGRRLLSWSEYVTVLTETEAIANSRPITYVNTEVDDGFRVLRPVDFLLYRPATLPIVDTNFPITDLGEGGKQLAALWKSRERYINKLWSLWYDEYVLSLRERANMFHRSSRHYIDRIPRIGEVVIVREEGLPRSSWKLARVTKLCFSPDTHVRAAEIKLANGTHVRRAVNFLIPLEIGGEITTTTSSNTSSHPSQENQISNQHVTIDSSSVKTPTEPEASSDLAANDEPFYGFSQEDIDRAADLLQLMNTIEVEEESDNHNH